MKYQILTLMAVLLSGCGTDVDGQKFRKEKDARIGAEIKVNESESYNALLIEMLSNVSQSETLQWAYVTSKTGEPVNTYEKAESFCQSIDYDLPTKEQFLGEGMTIKALKNFSGNTTIPAERFVFIKGGNDHIFGFLVCVRQIPAA